MRIVSLCPSITESVFGLGRGDALVGRTKFCVEPAGRVESLERVGGTKTPNVDRIVALAPDLVLMNEEENRREDAEALAAAGVSVLSTFARDVDGAARALVEIGDAIDAGVEARRVAAEIDALAVEVARRAGSRPRTPFAYVVWRDPLMAVGPGTYVDALLSLAGGRNVVASSERYPKIDLEALRPATHVLLASEPFPFAERHVEELVVKTGWPASRFRLVDGERLSWHGVRTLLGLPYAEEVLLSPG
jgi:ABC-type Fe3+-hydroxamate transport system substrate-binding protein